MALRLSFAAQTPSVVLSSTQSDEPDVRRHEFTALNHSRTPFPPCRTRIGHLPSRSVRKSPPHLLGTSQRNRNPRQSTFDLELHPCLRRYRLPRGIDLDHDAANSALSIASSSQAPARLVQAPRVLDKQRSDSCRLRSPTFPLLQSADPDHHRSPWP